MAGGKETPRQKMVGMMYLVLTALLALNVSKSILDAFVAIEENTQKSAIVQLDRGDGFKKNLSTMKKTSLNEKNFAKAAKCTYYLEMLSRIDNKTAEMIEFIDKIKFNILEKSGEKINSNKEKVFSGEGSYKQTINWSLVQDFTKNKSDYGVDMKDVIVWKKYDKSDPLRPSRLNLAAVQAKDQYDVPMHEIVGESIKVVDVEKSTDKFGINLWNKYNDYRAFIVETVGTHHAKSIDSVSGKGVGQPVYSVKTKPINEFKDNVDLDKKVEAMLRGTKMNIKDIRVLKDLYMELTKEKKFDNVNDITDVHWIGKTFDHSPLVAALASLSSMQLEILNARAAAAYWCSSQVGNASYSFNELVALADGPGTVADGEAFDITVVIGAYDTDNQPTATGGDFRYENGKAIMKAVGSGEDMTYKGTISIKDNNGMAKQLDWEKKISVIKSSGDATIQCTDLMVVYAGIPMKFTAAAGGMYKSVKVSPETVTAPQSMIGQYYTINATAVDKSGKSVPLKGQRYLVKPAPEPKVFWNGVGENGRALKTSGSLTCAYGNEVPFDPKKGNFSVVNYSITVSGVKGSLDGNGSTISPAHMNILKGVSGGNITIQVRYAGTSGGLKSVTFKN
jgi:hypothetical protein